MTTKWHVNVIVSARDEATAHLPPLMGTETGWMPGASLRQAQSLAGRVGHAMAQLCGAVCTNDPVNIRVNGSRYEQVFKAPRGTVVAIIARAGSTAGETERTWAYRKGEDLPS